ncbi:MAG: hypothetical protein AABW81_02325 [Nanoarchaeota archaeon]
MGDYNEYKVCQVLDKLDFRVVILREKYQPIISSEISKDSRGNFFHTPKDKIDILDFTYMVLPKTIEGVNNISIGNWAIFLGCGEIHVDTHPQPRVPITIKKIDSSCFYEVTFRSFHDEEIVKLKSKDLEKILN